MYVTSAIDREEERAFSGLFSSLRLGGAMGPEFIGAGINHHYATSKFHEDGLEYATSPWACKRPESV